MVRFDGVSKWFEGQGNAWMPALDAVDFSVAQDCFVAIVGPSGCGKSTLLNLCAGGRFTRSGWRNAIRALQDAGLLEGQPPSPEPGVLWTNQYLP